MISIKDNVNGTNNQVNNSSLALDSMEKNDEEGENILDLDNNNNEDKKFNRYISEYELSSDHSEYEPPHSEFSSNSSESLDQISSSRTKSHSKRVQFILSCSGRYNHVCTHN